MLYYCIESVIIAVGSVLRRAYNDRRLTTSQKKLVSRHDSESINSTVDGNDLYWRCFSYLDGGNLTANGAGHLTKALYDLRSESYIITFPVRFYCIHRLYFTRT